MRPRHKAKALPVTFKTKTVTFMLQDKNKTVTLLTLKTNEQTQ